MNRLKIGKKLAVISALVEGNSIRSTERMTGVHRDTIMRLLVDVGGKCEETLEKHLKGFHSKLIQADEIWTFIRKKERRLNDQEKLNPELGDQYVFVALDAESKLIPAYAVGKRDGATTLRFMTDLQARLTGNGKIQFTTDGFKAYIDAVEQTFGADIDFAQVIKVFTAEHPGPGRYSPPKVSGIISTIINGSPDPGLISTSYVERQNLTMRMAIRRFTRLTNAFSKKLTNLKAALALHFAHYNFVRIHTTLRVTPAMAAGVTSRLWDLGELIS